MATPTVRSTKSAHARARLDVLQPADLRLRHGGRYQWLRRAVLTISWGLVIGVPLLHAATLERASHGLFGVSIARYLPASPAVTTGIVGAPTSLAIGPLELVDPLAAFGVLVAGGGVAAAVILPLLLVMVFGRFFCGWICPYAPIVTVSTALRALLARFGWRQRDVRLPRRSNMVALALLLVLTAAGGSQIALLMYPPAVIGREVWRLVYFGGLGSGAAVLGLCFAFDTFYARAGTCRYLCPGGALFTLLGRWSPFTIVRDRALCTDCTLCDVVCPMMQSPMTDKVDAGCDRCARCVAVCPVKALHVGRRTP